MGYQAADWAFHPINETIVWGAPTAETKGQQALCWAKRFHPGWKRGGWAGKNCESADSCGLTKDASEPKWHRHSEGAHAANNCQ
jgi:hypothetical protein